MTLQLAGVVPSNIFALRGRDENSATIALGWAIDQCPQFRWQLISDLLGKSTDKNRDALIALQRHSTDRGFTDIEIVIDNSCHLIVEAKLGWALPSAEQLGRYVKRTDRHSVSRLIVSLSAADRIFASRRLPSLVDGVPVTHRSWADIKRIADRARAATTRPKERLWLDHLSRHLEDYVSMQNPRDNMVYVIALSSKEISDGDPYTWIDVVKVDRRYFDPVGGTGRLKLPPNYLAFRYQGQLQSVHHVAKHEVVTDLSEVHPRWPITNSDHFVFHLGPPMRPPNVIKGGRIQRATRVWCAIDTLLSGSFETLGDAVDATLARLPRQEGVEG